MPRQKRIDEAVTIYHVLNRGNARQTIFHKHEDYDAMNRLVKRTFDADGAGSGAAADQYWAYDEGINALLEFNGSATTNLKHRYLWSDQVDELLADSVLTNLTTAGNALWALSDHLGTIRDIADYTSGTDSTAITNHRTYNAYGKLVSETNSAVDLLFAFTGKQLDEATNLQHNLFRWYDSNLGQWLSEDPISFAAGDENVRRYVGNGHIDSVDPAGLAEPPSRASRINALRSEAEQRGRIEAKKAARQQAEVEARKSSMTNDGWRDELQRKNEALKTKLGTSSAKLSESEIENSLEKAIMAHASYMGVDYTEYLKDWYMLEGDQTSRSGSGLRWCVFKNRRTGGIVISFAGTELNNPIVAAEDIWADVRQGATSSGPQYPEALDITRQILDDNKGTKVTVVGHSLGGGLASFVAAAFRLPAEVFNAAGVNALMHWRLPSFNDSQITANIMIGDPLSWSQNDFLLTAPFMPSTIGSRVNWLPIEGTAPTGGYHSMDFFAQTIAEYLRRTRRLREGTTNEVDIPIPHPPPIRD